MPRGRHAQPDEIKALRGNPGRRRLALKGKPDAADRTAVAPKAVLTIPEFLTHDREKTIFRSVVEDYLQRRVARAPDLTAYARWAAYLHRWIGCKEQLGDKATWFKSTSKHGDLLRRHPLFKDMLDLERVMQSLEDRLGLNPVARQNIIRGLSTMPAALGGLFGDEPPHEDDKPPAEEMPDGASIDEIPVTPLGFLHQAGKPH
jgi:phage terminase small subunit